MNVINVFYYFGVTVREKNKLIKKIIRLMISKKKEKRDEDIRVYFDNWNVGACLSLINWLFYFDMIT